MTTHRVTLKVKDPSFEANGETYPGDLAAESETVWHIRPGDCDHKNSICMTCVRDWTEGYWATVHFGPARGKDIPPTWSLNEMVEIQTMFMESAQMLVGALNALSATVTAAGRQVTDWVTDAIREASGD